MPIIPALWRQRQEHGAFEANLDYPARPCIKKKKTHKEEVGCDVTYL
jgi:hypothetical protein